MARRAKSGRQTKERDPHRWLFVPPLARLGLAVVVGLIVGIAVPLDDVLPRILAGWNAASLTYLVFAGLLMAYAEEENIRKQADLEERSRALVLAIIVICSLAMIAAIVMELSSIAEGDPLTKAVNFGLAFTTILMSWLLVQTVYALFYAHEFHVTPSTSGQGSGLKFPGDGPPDYFDFLYFAFVVGTTFQTSDVDITSRRMRRIVMRHGLLAFFLNTAVIALTVNLTAQLAK